MPRVSSLTQLREGGPKTAITDKQQRSGSVFCGRQSPNPLAAKLIPACTSLIACSMR
jgi:hypothetical protein